MCDKSNERSEGGRIHVRNISVDEKYPPSMEGGNANEALQMTERKRERTKERSTNPRREFFCNFAWTSPLISTKQIHHGIIHGLSDTFAIAFCSILPSEKTIRKPILDDRVYARSSRLGNNSWPWSRQKEVSSGTRKNGCRICRENGRKSNGGGRWRREMYGRIPS